MSASGIREPFQEFKENIHKARELIRLAELKEITILIDNKVLEPLKALGITRFPPPPLPPLPGFPSPEELHNLIRETTNKIYEVGLPQVLVFAVSCLEAYLKDQYRLLNPTDPKRDKYNFLRAELVRKVYSAVLKRDVLKGNDPLERAIREIVIKRHVIVHRACIIDEKACLDGLERKLVGTKLPLSSKVVGEDLDKIELFASLIYDSVKTALRKG